MIAFGPGGGGGGPGGVGAAVVVTHAQSEDGQFGGEKLQLVLHQSSVTCDDVEWQDDAEDDAKSDKAKKPRETTMAEKVH